MPLLENILRDDPFSSDLDLSRSSVEGGAFINMPYYLNAMQQGNAQSPAWWSPARDDYLRRWVRTSDHVSSAKYAVQTRIASIPVTIKARNPNIEEHLVKRDLMQNLLLNFSEEGLGWEIAYSKFIDDVLGTDNGGFMVVTGRGNEWEPIIGMPTGVKHLDSLLCTRTDNPIFPVVYRDYQDGMHEKVIHWSRVISLALQPSTDSVMLGVGYCAVSRCLTMAERLIGISNYVAEKLGSRPLRAILSASGVSEKQMGIALAAAEVASNNQRLTRFSKLVALASLDTEIKIDLVDLAKLPDGFDEEISTKLAMTLIATAFGVDVREIWTAEHQGASRADALISNMKARGKSIGYISGYVERQMNLKFCPPYLQFTFDQTDDESDAQTAELRQKRAEVYRQYKTNGIAGNRTIRQMAVENGDMKEAQLFYEELLEGRLPDGTSVLSLYHSYDTMIKTMLTLDGIKDPLDVEGNDEKKVIDAIKKQERFINETVVNSNIVAIKQKGMMALSALKALRIFYNPEATPLQSPDFPIKLNPPEQLMPPMPLTNEGGVQQAAPGGKQTPGKPATPKKPLGGYTEKPREALDRSGDT